MSEPAKPQDVRSDRQRLVDEHLLPNPNEAQMRHASMTPDAQDPRVGLDRWMIDRLAEQVIEYRDLSNNLRERLGATDRQLMRAQNLLRYIQREGVGALGQWDDEAFEYAIGGTP